MADPHGVSRNIDLLSTWGAQSELGDVLVNRGPFALYWAQNIREIVYAYTHETFIGKLPIILGDDAALTLFSRDRGRTVQQVNAFCYAMHPETFRQHFKQWTRWMRGSIIRDCWRWSISRCVRGDSCSRGCVTTFTWFASSSNINLVVLAAVGANSCRYHGLCNSASDSN